MNFMDGRKESESRWLQAVSTTAPAQAETLLHSLKQTLAGIGLRVNIHKRNIRALVKEATSPH